MLFISNIQQFIKENPIDKLSLGQAKQVYNKVVEDLNTHNYLYYIKSQPVISDYEYDLLFHYLKDLEEKFPSLIKPYSPTQRLTNQVQEELKKAYHKYPLLSLENTYNPEEVNEKLSKIADDVKKIVQDDSSIGCQEYEKKDSLLIHSKFSSDIYRYIEPKYDGLSVELIYEDGIFKQAITRGDGYIGEDITENAKTIKTLPLKISYKGKLHIRGEVVIKKSQFEKVNSQRKRHGFSTYSNPRNLASGSLRQLDPSITAERNLDVVVYDILNREDIVDGGNSSIITDYGEIITDNNQLKTGIAKSYKFLGLSRKKLFFSQISYHHEILDFLEGQGFFVYDFKVITENTTRILPEDKIKQFYYWFHSRKSFTKQEVLEIVKSSEIKEILDHQDIEFDGLVIKVDNIRYRSLLKATSHHPKWAFAFKYPPKQISSQILNAELSVGRTGIITLIALLEPVEVGGVTIKRATLHNFDFIKEKDIHINDYVWIIRSGEVIPYIESVIRTEDKKQLIDLSLQEKILKQLNQQFIKKYDLNNLKCITYLDYLLKYKLYQNKQLVYKIKSPKGGEMFIIKIIDLPYCPVCGSETFHPEGEVALRCLNVTCPAQLKEKIVHFVSKQGLDIDGLSEKTIESFLKANLIYDYGDIFYLPEKREQIFALPGFQQKKIENIIQAILKKKEILLTDFLSALGIEFVGKKTAKLIMEKIRKEIGKLPINKSKNQKRNIKRSEKEKQKEISLSDIIFEEKDSKIYVDFRKLMDLFISDKGYELLLSISGIGPKVAESVRKFFHEKHNYHVIKKILKKVKIYIPVRIKGRFFGQQFVITGSIKGISRDQIAKFIQTNQGEFSNQITQNTTLLLVGDNPGRSKLEKAKKYGISVYDLRKFLKENGFNMKLVPRENSLF